MPNQYFDNIPIEYKEINEDDFDSKLYNVEPKHLIELDKKDNGFIGNKLLPILSSDFKNRNTTIINAGVGQGKTTAILNALLYYADKEEYVVIVAVPFKSLITQYEKECIGRGVSKQRIFNLLEIDNFFKKEEKQEEKKSWGEYVDDEEWIKDHQNKFNIRNYDIHILTVNALLGNSGESLLQSRKRTEYFNRLQGYCKKQNKKIILLFDEIHASIHNFKERFIYKLWNYYGLVHKAYIVSATFNEASKEVIKYLSEFTDNNIKIIESLREPVKEKQSDLFLNFYIDEQLDKDKSLIDLISNLLANKKRFDILVYSKTLAEKLIKYDKKSKTKKVGHLFRGRELEINKCFSNVFNPTEEKRYDKSKINIGTNFSTGISIEKEEHTFIVLFPKNLSVKFLNNKGIFTNGSNSIIQALARQREKGEIHIFLPNPLGLSEKSLPKNYSKTQKTILLDEFEKCKILGDNFIKYSDINKQRNVLNQLYGKLHYEVESAIKSIDGLSRKDEMNRLLFPTKEILILSHGEKHLVRDFFGGNLPSYILWASITNQFLNCRLKNIKIIDRIYFENKDLFFQVKKLIEKQKFSLVNLVEYYSVYHSMYDFEKIKFFIKSIYSMFIVIDGKKATLAEKQNILLMILKVLFFESDVFNSRKDKKEILQYYLASCFCHSNELLVNEVPENYFSEKIIKIIKVFKKWGTLIDIIEANQETYKKHTFISEKTFKAFSKKYKALNFNEDFQFLMDNDLLLSTNVFAFKDTFSRNKTKKEMIDSVYNLTKAVFFIVKSKPIKIDKNTVRKNFINRKKIESIPNLLFKELPELIL